MTNIITRLYLDDKQFDARMKNAGNSVTGFGAKMENLASKSGAGVVSFFTKLGGVVGVGVGAFEAFNKTINSTTVTADAFNLRIEQVKASTDLFFSSLATADFSSFFSKMERAIELAGDYRKKMDELEATQFFGGIDFYRAEAKYNEAIGNLQDRLLSNEERKRNEGIAREQLGVMKGINKEEQARIKDVYLSKFKELMAEKGYLNAKNLTEEQIEALLSNGGRASREAAAAQFGRVKSAVDKANTLSLSGFANVNIKKVNEARQWMKDNVGAEAAYYASLIDEGSEEMQAIKSNIERFFSLKKQIDNFTTSIDNATARVDKNISSLAKKNEIKQYSPEWWEKNIPEKIKVSQELELDIKPYVNEKTLLNWADNLQYEKIITKRVERKKIGFDPSAVQIDMPDLNSKWVEEMQNRASANEIFAASLGGIGEAMGHYTGVLNDNAAAWLSYTSGVLSSISQLIPQLSALFAKQSAVAIANAAAGAGVFGWINAGVMAASVIAAVASIPKLANGGIAFGNSLVNVGEYPGAGGNPEVIAPLNKLREYITPRDENGGTVEFKIKGRDLLGVLNKENNFKSRTK